MDTGSVPPPLRPALEALAAAVRNREPAIREQVELLRAQSPGLPPEALSRILIAKTRRRLATSGALSGAAAIVPGLGTVLAVGSVTGQSLYSLEQEVELVMGVAMLHGHELAGSDERLLEALVLVGVAGGAVKLRDGVLVAGGQRITVAAFRRLPQHFAARAGGHLLSRVAGRLAATRAVSSAARVAPLAVGLVAGAGFDWIAVTALGRAALRYYGPGGPAARSATPLAAGGHATRAAGRLSGGDAAPALPQPGHDAGDVEVHR